MTVGGDGEQCHLGPLHDCANQHLTALTRAAANPRVGLDGASVLVIIVVFAERAYTP